MANINYPTITPGVYLPTVTAGEPQINIQFVPNTNVPNTTITVPNITFDPYYVPQQPYQITWPPQPAYTPLPENKNIDPKVVQEYVNKFFAEIAKKEKAPQPPSKIEAAPEVKLPTIKSISRRKIRIEDK